ncbi:MAG TPA: putative toxin-antitoxin system toxin component, PIN family [Pyrinomonadaceae bacterium]|nr:putative toxin-antitoxin system toxin component, PIN family [Pyrinomonadaceae bacterium]
MNILVDTNVVVSALIRDGLPRRVIEEIVAHGDWFWIVTVDIENEYREVLARPKFKIPPSIQQGFNAFVEMVTIRVQPVSAPSFPRDPKDELFIAAALACDADYLITGDKDLLDEQPLPSTQILNPAQFARLFGIA